jgi:hypothetical protein
MQGNKQEDNHNACRSDKQAHMAGSKLRANPAEMNVASGLGHCRAHAAPQHVTSQLELVYEIRSIRVQRVMMGLYSLCLLLTLLTFQSEYPNRICNFCDQESPRISRKCSHVK